MTQIIIAVRVALFKEKKKQVYMQAAHSEDKNIWYTRNATQLSYPCLFEERMKQQLATYNLQQQVPVGETLRNFDFHINFEVNLEIPQSSKFHF